jgi:hypothetical protein
MAAGLILDTTLVFAVGFICLVFLGIGLFVGFGLGTLLTSGYTVGRAVQQSILRDLLATPARERSDRVLDLCFFPLADDSFLDIDTNAFLTDEVINHHEARINDPSPTPRQNPQPLFRVDELYLSASDSFHAVYNVPSIAQPMDYEKGVLTVINRILKYKMKRKSDDDFSYENKLCAPRENGQHGDIEKSFIFIQPS